MNWINAIHQLSGQNQSYAIVTILKMEGSAPRDQQAKMVVTPTTTFDTIGGGNLEYQAITKSRLLLKQDKGYIGCETFSLGRDLTQCCGGKVELLFEVFPACDFHILLFGAGHVGQALMKIIAELPCQVQWIDSRSDQFPENNDYWENKTNVEMVVSERPFEFVESCPENAYYLIMTHSHETDFELCEAILSRSDIRYCGLIGSRSKAAKFRSRLSKKGFTDAEISRLICPMGSIDVPGKTPMEVSVSIAAELLNRHHTPNGPST